MRCTPTTLDPRLNSSVHPILSGRLATRKRLVENTAPHSRRLLHVHRLSAHRRRVDEPCDLLRGRADKEIRVNGFRHSNDIYKVGRSPTGFRSRFCRPSVRSIVARTSERKSPQKSSPTSAAFPGEFPAQKRERKPNVFRSQLDHSVERNCGRLVPMSLPAFALRIQSTWL
jgi:hypothetical protein